MKIHGKESRANALKSDTQVPILGSVITKWAPEQITFQPSVLHL